VTLSELESAFNALSKRLDQIERLLKTAVSHKQLNEVTLILEKKNNDLTSAVTQLTNRVNTLETTVANII
jgi:hypothetical protein